jgi:hypothetical protein
VRQGELAGLRLRNQRLTAAPLAAPEDVVRWLVAVQSQEHAAAKWSIGQRAASVTERVVDDALARGAIVRTHVLRPTWHFVLAADVGWLLDLTAPRVRTATAHALRTLGLDAAARARCERVIVGALEGGRHRTREQLAAALGDAGVVLDGRRLAHVLMQAELDQLLCGGAPSGGRHTYALFAERLPDAPRRERDEALGELARRYFASHGPATLLDYRSWASLTAAEARRGIEIAGAELERVEVDATAYWWQPTSVPPAVRRAPVAWLLQGYDEYVIAYRESKRVFDAAGLAGAKAARRSPFTHAVVVDGQVLGHWRRVSRARESLVEVRLGRALRAGEQRALARAVADYGAFTGVPTRLAD